VAEQIVPQQTDEETPEARAGRHLRELGAASIRRLTLFKWRYSLESAGFTTREAQQLLFVKWLAARPGGNHAG
jgi:hypothetical protein